MSRALLALAIALTAAMSATDALALSASTLRIDSGKADQAASVTTDSRGNVYIAGATAGDSSRADFTVVKLNAQGARQWTAKYSGSGNGVLADARAVVADTLGNIYAAGHLIRSSDPSRMPELVLVKLDAQGRELWSRRHPAARGLRLGLDSQGDVYVGGDVGGDWLVQKYASGGALQWSQRFNGTIGNNDHLTDLAVDGAGNVVATGWTDSSDGLRQATDIAVVKFDTQGTRVWQRLYSDTTASDDKPWDLALDAAGNVYVTGVSGVDTSGELPEFPVTLMYASDGALVFTRRGDGFGGGAITVDSSGEIFVAGSRFTSHVTRLDAAGHVRWTTVLNTTATDKIAVAANGQIFVSGGVFATTQLDNAGRIIGEHRLASNNFRDRSVDLAIDAFGTPYVVGTSFTSTITSSADIVALRFAVGDAPTPLAAPTNLTATASAQQVRLQWIDNADRESAYLIERCQGAGCTDFSEIGRVGANVISFVDTNVSPNARLTYRVRAMDAVGTSAPSNAVSVRIRR
jgi:hypothetical protein